MLAAHVVPGLLSLPLNIIVVVDTLRIMRKAGPTSLPIVKLFNLLCAALALGYVCLSSIPGLALQYDVGCLNPETNGLASFNYIELFTNNTGAFKPSTACNAAAAATFFLHALLISVICMLYEVRKCLVSANINACLSLGIINFVDTLKRY